MTPTQTLAQALAANDARLLADVLRAGGPALANHCDEAGQTPLMRVAADRNLDAGLMRVLLDAGAEPDQMCAGPDGESASALFLALSACDAGKAALLLDGGASLRGAGLGSAAMLRAAYGATGRPSDDVVALLRLLADRGAPMDDITRHGESAVSVLSNSGQFAGLRVLLDAGADPAPLGWTPLHHAIVFASLTELNAQLDAGADAEARDSWERTPLLLAIQAGDLHKVELLLLHGVARDARGRCGKPAVFYAIESGDVAVLEWLLDAGFSLLDTDQFGMSALAYAAEHGQFAAVQRLLFAGLDPDQHDDHRNALYQCTDPALARLLLDAGAHPENLPFEMRRALVGFPSEPDVRLLDANAADFARDANPRFGRSNPERTDCAFWRAMLRSGVDAWTAHSRPQLRGSKRHGPVWCARRHGQSITFLPDGRIIQIGGEHEDSYDPDFCIYNDVFVHHRDGRFEIYGYPEADFPPTDFHTATLVGDAIYVIGSLGYHDRRRPAHTPVYALDVLTLRITPVAAGGEEPGWIHRHSATLLPNGTIRVSGGRIEPATPDGRRKANAALFDFDPKRRMWTRVESG